MEDLILIFEHVCSRRFNIEQKWELGIWDLGIWEFLTPSFTLVPIFQFDSVFFTLIPETHYAPFNTKYLPPHQLIEVFNTRDLTNNGSAYSDITLYLILSQRPLWQRCEELGVKVTIYSIKKEWRFENIFIFIFWNTNFL